MLKLKEDTQGRRSPTLIITQLINQQVHIHILTQSLVHIPTRIHIVIMDIMAIVGTIIIVIITVAVVAEVLDLFYVDIINLIKTCCSLNNKTNNKEA